MQALVLRVSQGGDGPAHSETYCLSIIASIAGPQTLACLLVDCNTLGIAPEVPVCIHLVLHALQQLNGVGRKTHILHFDFVRYPLIMEAWRVHRLLDVK